VHQSLSSRVLRCGYPRRNKGGGPRGLPLQIRQRSGKPFGSFLDKCLTLYYGGTRRLPARQGVARPGALSPPQKIGVRYKLGRVGCLSFIYFTNKGEAVKFTTKDIQEALEQCNEHIAALSEDWHDGSIGPTLGYVNGFKAGAEHMALMMLLWATREEQ
jgi:hypothetical protein